MIAYKVDRISRNIADYSVIRGTLRRYGVEIRSVTEFFEDTPAGRFMENIIANVGQFDNDVRAERCLGGMMEAVQEGRYVWKAPPGYVNVKQNNKSTIAPGEQSGLILKVFELIATRIYSTNDIRNMIAEEGLVNRKGEPVTRSVFFCLIRNPLYKGVIKKFGKEYQASFEPIVPVELFNTVQSILSGKKKPMTHYLHENPDFPLRRFLTDEAGNKATGYWSQGKRLKYPYYSFKIKNSTIRKEELEKKFMDFLSQFEFNAKHLDRLSYHLHMQFGSETENQKSEVEIIQTQITDRNKQIDGLIALMTKGGISLSTCTERVKKLESELERLKDLLKTRPQKQYDVAELMDFAREALKEPHKVWQKSPFNIKQGLQVFDFPEGLIFDGNNFRTPKICNLYALVDQISDGLSGFVDFPDKTKNTVKRLNSPYCVKLIDTKAFWEIIVEELLKLKSILSETKRRC